MRLSLLMLLCLGPLAVLAQEKAYDIALSYGAYTSPSFKQNTARNYFSADFDYHLSKRWTVSSGFMTGQFNYYDANHANTPIGSSTVTNARGFQLHGYAMAKYSLISTNRFAFQVGVGAGFFNQRLEYPYQDAQSSYITQSSFTDLAFPVSVEAYYLVNRKVGIGIKAGGYIEPDFPIVGAHIGPQIRVRL